MQYPVSAERLDLITKLLVAAFELERQEDLAEQELQDDCGSKCAS